MGDHTEALASRRLATSLVLSLTIVVCGMIWTWRVGQESGRYYHEASHLEDSVAAVRHALQKRGIDAR